MTFTDSLLFHYTSVEAAMKIILTGELRFGRFEDMNDIMESRREVYSRVNNDAIEKYLSAFQAICLTDDSPSLRGFAIDCLCGYYANKGNGVCLVFDKKKLLSEYGKVSHGISVSEDMKVRYIENFTNAILVEGDNLKDAKSFINGNIDDIFYTKSSCWEHENELRLLVRNKKMQNLPLGDALTGVILHANDCDEGKKDDSYRLFHELQKLRCFKIYFYIATMCNKELLADDGTPQWPLLGVDYELNF